MRSRGGPDPGGTTDDGGRLSMRMTGQSERPEPEQIDIEDLVGDGEE